MSRFESGLKINELVNSFIDWLIIAVVLLGMIYSVSFTKGLMKSVTDFLSAGTRRNLALTTASISSYGVLNEIRAMHKILELIPKTKQVVESFPNPWAGE